MTNNTHFLNLATMVADLAAAVTAYIKALEDAATKSTESIARKNRCLTIVLKLLSDLGLSINAAAKGDGEILGTTGYPLAKVPAPRSIGNPGITFLKQGIASGILNALVKPDVPAPIYMFEITSTDPESSEEVVWLSYASTISKYAFTGLVPGKKYWVRVVAVGKRGQRIVGPVSSAIVV